MSDLTSAPAFDWDRGNRDKNWLKHQVTNQECEAVFFNQPVVLFDDEVHSGREKRYGLLGETDEERGLAIVFTLRWGKIRVISARDQNKKERAIYREEKERLNARKEAA